nr:trichohyalin isoform X2 [Misgurnus anguillicaudatus]
MAMLRGDRSSLSPLGHRSDPGWVADLGRGSSQNALRSSSPIAFSDLDFWDNKMSSAWSCIGLSGSNHRSEISSQYGQESRGSLGMQRWSSGSRLAPEGAPRSHSTTEDFKLKADLEKSCLRRAELIQKLRETKSHLEAQTDLLKTKETQLQQSHNISHFLELKHKQLSETVSVLQQDRKAADESRFEESRRRTELQDKVMQLELEILKMRSNLERRTSPTSTNPKPPLTNTLPITKDEILREGQKQTEKEMNKLREALRKTEDRADELEYEKNDALRRLQSFKEGNQEAMNQKEELNQRLNQSVQVQAELEDQLKESCNHLEQIELERDMLSSKTRRLEDSQNDLKAKLTRALMDKDRLVQEKAELHQKVQALELQLQREQRGKQSFNEQVCELHTELSQAKNQANREKKDNIFMKEEMLSIKELNEKLSSDLTKATERLQVTLNQQHELEADKLIRINQIAALETERLKLLGEKEELRKNVNDGVQDEIRELKERCCQHRELQDNLKQENQNLQVKCQDLVKEMQIMEAECKRKEEELHRAKVGFEQKKEELRKVSAHWNERWLDVSLMLCSTQEELEEVKKQKQENNEDSSEELDREVKEKPRKVKIKDTQLVEHQLELQSARGQVSQQIGEMQRLEQLLEETDHKLRQKEQDLKNLEIQRETEKAEAQIKILSLEQKLLKDKDLHSEAEVVSNKHNPEDFESLKALLEEDRETTEKLTEERNHALQQLHDLDRFQQSKAVKESPTDTKKQKAAGLDLVDPNEQRRLVTEQLKNLFKEREQRGERFPVLPKRSGLLENGVQNPESIKHPLVAPAGSLASGLKTNKGAPKTSTKTFADHRASKMADGEERTNAQMSAVRGEMENRKERDENVLKVISPHQIETLKARSQPRDDATLVTVPHLQNMVKGTIQQEKSQLGCKDGTFFARQIEICNSDVEHTEESNSGEETVDTPLLEY